MGLKPQVEKVEKNEIEDKWENLVYNQNESMKDVLRFRQLRSYIDKKIPEILQQKKTLFIPFNNSRDAAVITLGVYISKVHKLYVRYNKDGILIFPQQNP